MLEDRYGNKLSTASQPARDAYVDGVDRFLESQHGAEAAFRRAVAEDEAFAVAHVGVARSRLTMNDRPEAAAAISLARDASKNSSPREAAHVEAIGQLVDGNGPTAYKLIRAHVVDHPRDVMIAQTCTSVFGLIGFSGRAGREAEQLAYTTQLAPAYGDDWWFLGMHAFAQGEIGQLESARETIERSLKANPRSAQSAHVSAHIHYEAGENDTGFRYLKDWWKDYDPGGALHGHISWHIALWLLGRGESDEAWQIIDDHCKPGGSVGPPLNILSDTVAFLQRASLAGIDVPQARWREISDYAANLFPNAGIAFGDVHAALAHCMAGNDAAFNQLTEKAVGPAAEIVKPIWRAFHAFADRDWDGVESHLAQAMAGHERIGGSRAQRDLLEFTLVYALRQQGKDTQAERMIAMRRPRQGELVAG